MHHTAEFVTRELVDVQTQLSLFLICHGLALLPCDRGPGCPQVVLQPRDRLQVGGMIAFHHLFFATEGKTNMVMAQQSTVLFVRKAFLYSASHTRKVSQCA